MMCHYNCITLCSAQSKFLSKFVMDSFLYQWGYYMWPKRWSNLVIDLARCHRYYRVRD